MKKLNLLLTNDDGYSCIGLLSLLNELTNDYSTKVIAPNTGKSWISKAITPKSLRLNRKIINNRELFYVAGTPADCVQVGIYNSTPKPDLVISGINIGENAGLGWILSSGTVGAALEAALQGIPAVAVSYQFPLKEREGVNFYNQKNSLLYETPAKVAKKIIDKLIAGNFHNQTDLFIINLPYKVSLEAKVEITKIDDQSYGQLFYPNSNLLTFKTQLPDYTKVKPGTDLEALSQKRVSVTAIRLGLTTPNKLFNELKSVYSTPRVEGTSTV